MCAQVQRILSYLLNVWLMKAKRKTQRWNTRFMRSVLLSRTQQETTESERKRRVSHYYRGKKSRWWQVKPHKWKVQKRDQICPFPYKLGVQSVPWHMAKSPSSVMGRQDLDMNSRGSWRGKRGGHSFETTGLERPVVLFLPLFVAKHQKETRQGGWTWSRMSAVSTHGFGYVFLSTCTSRSPQIVLQVMPFITDLLF